MGWFSRLSPWLPTALHSHQTVWVGTPALTHHLAMTLDLPPHLTGFSFLDCKIRMLMVLSSQGWDRDPVRINGSTFTTGHGEAWYLPSAAEAR